MVEDYRKNTGKYLRKVAGRGQCPWHKPAYLGIVFSRSFHPEGENHEDASYTPPSVASVAAPPRGIPPLFKADTANLTVSASKDGKLRVVYAGWDDANAGAHS